MSAFPTCVWCGPVFEPTGYADEGRGLLVALERAGVPVVLRPAAERPPGFRAQLPSDQVAIFDRQIGRALGGSTSSGGRTSAAPFVLVQHYLADGFVPAPQAAWVVGRTMFETNSLPPHWVSRCNAMDELWVPSTFARETFAQAGVRVPMHIVPEGVEAAVWNPDVPPLQVPGVRGTVFLAVFEWRARKGWDVLLRAWASAFGAGDDVTLVLRTQIPAERRVSAAPAMVRDRTAEVNARIDAFLSEHCGRQRGECAPIVVLGDALPAGAMSSLYTAAHAFVLPTRGEGWGRPFMEAMASGLPVIATRWSAHLEFMNDDNSVLVDPDGLEAAWDPDIRAYDGHQWAKPSVAGFAQAMRRVHGDRSWARALGARALADVVAHWPWSRAARAMAERLTAVGAHIRVGGERPSRVAQTIDCDGWWATTHGDLASDVRFTPVAARVPRPTDVGTLLVLPVLEPADLPVADLVLRLWQRIGTETGNARLQLLVSSTAGGAVQAWGDAHLARLLAGKLAPGLSAEVLVTELDAWSVSAFVRSADAVLALRDEQCGLRELVRACGTALVRPQTATAAWTPDGDGATNRRRDVEVPLGPNGSPRGLELSAALRALCGHLPAQVA